MTITPLLGPNGKIPILIRDDDTNFFTKSNMLETIYSKAWNNQFKVSLSVIPYQKTINDVCVPPDKRNYPEYHLIRQNMGYTRSFAERIDLRSMLPHAELSSTRYCLADPGNKYFIYFPEGNVARIDLRDAAGEYFVEWFIPLMNKKVVGPRSIKGGDYVKMQPPVSIDAVLYLQKK